MNHTHPTLIIRRKELQIISLQMIIHRLNELGFTQWTDIEYSQVFTGGFMNIHYKALIILNLPDIIDKGHLSCSD